MFARPPPLSLLPRKTAKGKFNTTFKYKPRSTEVPELEAKRVSVASEKARLQRKVPHLLRLKFTCALQAALHPQNSVNKFLFVLRFEYNYKS
jgi:hypothetical protein